ncbi:hypothetical protein [Actinomadura sp. 9N407]|uniref:hypothetical protein n=1 Tax=Actinomadura sp. 9N407 TaxID=3375154 RepID=UPI00378EBA27
MDERRVRGVPRRRTLAVLAAGAAACVLAGLGLTAARSGDTGSGTPSSASASAADVGRPDERAIATVLANRADAVRKRDRAAFMATVATAPAAYRQAQSTMLDNLLKLPLDGWRERFERVESTTGGAALVQVNLRYRLRGHDDAPLTRTRHLAFAPRSGLWVIAGDGTSRGRPDDAAIWDGGPLTVVKGRAGLVIGDAPGLDEIARRLDEAVPAVSRVAGPLAGRDWSRRAVALVPADSARAGALAGGGGLELGEIAALATVVPTAGGPGADRIVIAPDTFGRLNDLGRDVVLTHELTHVATGGARDGRTPLWLIEGFADYVGYKGRAVSVRSAARELHRDVAAGRLPAALPGRAAFDGGSGRLAQSYQEAWLACRMIADRYGEAALVRLYRTAGERPEAAALREVLGLSPAGLTAAWRDHLRKELG